MGYFKHYLIFFPRPELIFDGGVEVVSVLLIFCQGLEKRVLEKWLYSLFS